MKSFMGLAYLAAGYFEYNSRSVPANILCCLMPMPASTISRFKTGLKHKQTGDKASLVKPYTMYRAVVTSGKEFLVCG